MANRAALAVRRRGAAVGRGALRLATVHPGRVVLVALVVAVAGWGLDTQTRVESDLTKLVPQNGAIHDLQALQRSTGVGGEIDVVVSGPRVTDPAVVRWMTGYQAAVLKRFGYSDKRGCGTAELCPAFSLPDLFRSGPNATRQQIAGLLDAVPPYFSQGVITADRRTATLAFGIRLMPLDRQQSVIDGMRDRLHPPAGIDAELAGLPVLAAEANAAVSSPWRRLGTLRRRPRRGRARPVRRLPRWQRALVPLLPIALATGWSALVLFALRIPLNPMSVTLGALVIAISTEFSVLLSERYRAERAAGHEPGEALQRTYRSTGAAVLASGTTAIAGFAVLVVSDIRMLRDFGFVTVVDLTVALLGVMVVLPAVLLLAEQGRLRLRCRGLAPARRVNPQRAPTGLSSAATAGSSRSWPWCSSATSRCTRCAPSARGVGRAGGGLQLPPFAAPLALGPLDGDVNVARKPDQGAAGKRPACTVRGPGILNSCELGERGPFALAFLATRGAQCTRELDVLAARPAAPSRACRSPPCRSAATATTCARSCAATAGASRSPGTSTGAWPTSSASRSARSSPTRCRAAWCRRRASASSTAPSSTPAHGPRRASRGMRSGP